MAASHETSEVETTSKAEDTSSKFDSVNSRKLLFVEYPGYIRNVDTMLETLGGIKKLSETYFKTKCRLPLTYRPEDLNAHTACGDLVPHTGLLIKVKRRKKAGTKDGYEYRQEIVGTVRDQYKFQYLMDYQYLTPEPLWNYFKDIHGTELASTNFPPYYAPPTFARLDRPGTYDYKPDLTSVGGIKKDDQKSPDMLDREVARKRRQTESMAALFTSEHLPQKPSEKSINVIQNLMEGPEKDNILAIGKLFDERPMWSKAALTCKVDVGVEKLKKILAHYSFYWLSGPWRTMWCRMGYDPRKDPTSKIYQMLDFRVRNSAKKRYKVLIPKRSYKNYVPATLRNVVNRAPSSVPLLSACKESDEKRVEDTEPYIFRPDKMIISRSTMYQLCDILDPGVQEIIRESDGKEGPCDEREGWFPPGTMQRIRDQMSKTVEAYFAKEREKHAKNNQGVDDAETGDSGNVALDEQEYYETEEDDDLQEEANDYENFNFTKYLQEGDTEEEYDDDIDYYR